MQNFTEIFISKGEPPVSMKPVANFATSSASDVETDGKFAAGVNDTGGKFATGVNDADDTGGKFATGVNNKKYDNSTTQRYPKEIMKIFLIEDFFQVATGVNDTCGAPSAANISANFEKIRNSLNGIFRGLGETDPCRKPKVENLVALSL